MGLRNFLSSKSNESSKRLIAAFFSLALIGKYLFENSEKLNVYYIVGFFVLITLLLGLATIETLADIWKNKN